MLAGQRLAATGEGLCGCADADHVVETFSWSSGRLDGPRQGDRVIEIDGLARRQWTGRRGHSILNPGAPGGQCTENDESTEQSTKPLAPHRRIHSSQPPKVEPLVDRALWVPSFAEIQVTIG